MLEKAIRSNKILEIEAVAGTDWHHYSYCWALKAVQLSSKIIDKKQFHITGRVLKYIDSHFHDGRGYCEPYKKICNVRSIFNNVLAINSVINTFDPLNYLILEEIMNQQSYKVLPKSIFLSYSFQSKDKELVEGLKKLLETAGYTVLTGEKNPIGSLSKSILDKIKQSEKFIVVMTCRDKKENNKYTTSSWLLEEKGAAIVLDKPCLMLVEDGIDEKEIGGLQGDDQRLQFNRNNFTSKVADTLNMIG